MSIKENIKRGLHATLSRKTGFYLASLLVLLFLAGLALAPLQTRRDYREWAEADSLLPQAFNPAYGHPGLAEAVREKAFREALLKAASGDSIGLVIDLSDSSVALYIKGVRIHETRISAFKGDRLLSSLPALQWEALFSRTLAIQEQEATIVKKPIVVREAPSNPEEAALNAWMPDTLIQKPAFVRFSVEHRVELILEQDRNPAFKDHWKRFMFHAKIGLRGGLEATGRFATFKKQVYHPTLYVKLPVDDLRAIYRALPGEPRVVITM